MKKVNCKKPKKPRKIYDDSFNLITSEEDQISKIKEFFDDLFSSDETQISVTPEKMESPFTPEEIQKALQKLKNNKAIGPDGVHAENLNYEPNELFVTISEILNKTSETVKYPENIRLGTLNPVAKPPKKNEKVNVRPIIL